MLDGIKFFPSLCSTLFTLLLIVPVTSTAGFGKVSAVEIAALKAQQLPFNATVDMVNNEVISMREHLGISCKPVIDDMTQLLTLAETYRQFFIGIEKDYANSLSLINGEAGHFALPGQNAGLLESGSSFFFFNEVNEIRSEASKLDLLLSFNSKKQTPPVTTLVLTESTRQLFFFSAAPDVGKTLTKKIAEYRTKLKRLSGEWTQKRKDYLLFFNDSLLKRKTQEYIKRSDELDDIRKAYVKKQILFSDKVRADGGRLFEHCLGIIKGQELISVVQGQGGPLNFFEEAPEDTLKGLPGMGFNLVFKPDIKSLTRVKIPAKFPYQLGFKFHQEPIVQIALDKCEAEIALAVDVRKERTGVFSDTVFEGVGLLGSAIGEGIVSIGEGFADLAAGLKSLATNTSLASIDKTATLLLGLAGPDANEQFGEAVAAPIEKFAKGTAGALGLLKDLVTGNKIEPLPDNATDVQELEQCLKFLALSGQIDGAVSSFATATAFAIEALTGELVTAGAIKAGKAVGVIKQLNNVDALTLARNNIRTNTFNRGGGLGSSLADAIDLKDVLRNASLSDTLKIKFAKENAQIIEGRRELVNDIEQLTLKQQSLIRQEEELIQRFANNTQFENKTSFDDFEFTNIVDETGFPIGAGNNNLDIGRQISNSGGSSSAFESTDPNKILRLTPLDKVGLSIAPKDELGRQLLESTSDTTKGLVRVVERDGDPFFIDAGKGVVTQVEVNERIIPADTLIQSQGGITKGQRLAFNRGVKALNDEGILFFDNTLKNVSFEHTGPGIDDFKLVVFDTGGIVRAKGDSLADKIANANLGQSRFDNFLAGDFDEKVFNEFGKEAFGDEVNDLFVFGVAQGIGQEFTDDVKGVILAVAKDKRLASFDPIQDINLNKLQQTLLDKKNDLNLQENKLANLEEKLFDQEQALLNAATNAIDEKNVSDIAAGVVGVAAGTGAGTGTGVGLAGAGRLNAGGVTTGDSILSQQNQAKTFNSNALLGEDLAAFLDPEARELLSKSSLEIAKNHMLNNCALVRIRVTNGEESKELDELALLCEQLKEAA